MDDAWPDLGSVADLAELTRAFEACRSRLRAMLERRIDPVLGPRLDADDLLHEAFLRARRRWGRAGGPGPGDPYPWLYGLARDCLFEAWRRETRPGRDPRRELPWPERSSVQLGLSLVGTATSPSQALVRAELRDRVRRAIEQLRPADREILWMRHFDELSFRDAAAVLGIHEDAAMQRYSRALRRLRAAWGEAWGTDEGGA